MDNDSKNISFDTASRERDSDSQVESAPRARNRTVMLTPEITGQVRARLAQDLEQGHNSVQPQDDPNLRGFEAVGQAASSSSSLLSSAAGGQRRAIVTPPAPEQTSYEQHTVQQPVAARQPAQSVAPAQPTEHTFGITWTKKSPVVGFLVSFDKNPNGDIYDLRSGRLIISSEAASSGNCMLLEDETVSPMHAILRIAATGEIQVLDQLSEFGTKIKRYGGEEEIELSGDKGTLQHGDLIKFGSRAFHVCLLSLGS